MAKRQKPLRLKSNNRALRLRLKNMAHHVPVKSIGATVLATVATGIAIGFFLRR